MGAYCGNDTDGTGAVASSATDWVITESASSGAYCVDAVVTVVSAVY